MSAAVVIPTFNAGAAFQSLLDRLSAQKPLPPSEIIVVDSGSTDQTKAVALAAGARIIEWNKPYNHGLARDAGIAAANSEIVLLTVQDALPAGTDWLARMVA